MYCEDCVALILIFFVSSFFSGIDSTRPRRTRKLLGSQCLPSSFPCMVVHRRMDCRPGDEFHQSFQIPLAYTVSNLKGTIQPLKIRPSSKEPIYIVLRSRHLKNYFLDSPVKPGNDGGGGYRIPCPTINRERLFKSCAYKM